MVNTTDTAGTPDERHASAHELARWLMQARHLRLEAKAQPLRAGRRQALRAFQAARLARTHADLLASTRYQAAAEFFLSDLYGPKDLGARDAEIERVLPLITNALPTAGLRALQAAAELDALSEQLDATMVTALDGKLDTPLTDADCRIASRMVSMLGAFGESRMPPVMIFSASLRPKALRRSHIVCDQISPPSCTPLVVPTLPRSP